MYRLFHCLCYYCVSVCIFQGFPVPFLKRGRHFSLLSNYKKFLGIIIWKIITCGWLIVWLTCPKKIKSVLLFVLQCTLISVTNDTSSSWLFRLKTCDDCVEKFLEEFNERVQNLTVGEFEKLVSCICSWWCHYELAVTAYCALVVYPQGSFCLLGNCPHLKSQNDLWFSTEIART